MKKDNSSGFTLLELMLVIGIIALLTAVAVPNFRPVLHGAQLDQGIQVLQGDVLRARQLARENADNYEAQLKVVDQYSYQIELIDVNEENVEVVVSQVFSSSKQLADGCAFQTSSVGRVFRFDATGQALTGFATELVVENQGDTGRVKVFVGTGRVEVEYP